MKLQILLLLAFSVFVSAGGLDTVSGALGETNTSGTDLAINALIVERLRERYTKAVKSIKDARENGKIISQEVIKKLVELIQKMKDNGIQIDENALIARIREVAPGLGKELAALLG